MATNTYVALDKVTVATATPSITFTSIPQGYTDLVIVGNLGSETTNAFAYLQFNGDTGSNYSYTQLYGTGSSALSARVTNTSQLFNSDISVKQGAVNSNVIYQIMNYANTTTYKTSLSRQNTVDAADYNGSLAAVGLWRGSTGSSTEAITSVSIKLIRSGTPYNFSNGSTFSLYGIAAEGVSPATKATGGAIYSDADYYYHVFGATGALVPTEAVTVDVLAVAGGGGSGGNWGSGGGAGGVLLTTGVSLASGTSYTASIGAGGAGTANGNSAGSTGVNSNLTGGSLSLTPAYGGGYGGGGSGGSGGNGGSGGGASYNGTGGSGVAGQGFKGGDANPAPSTACGGGAGEAATKNTGTFSVGVRPGDGTTAYASWAIPTGTGEFINGNYYYGGGGADGQGQTARNSYGGGRRNLTNVTNGGAGVPNTGAGGSANGTGAGSAGGSGLIIIRYLKA